ncbi:hypothetical protein Plhal703r1_c04g0023901 [Plasmopara halstedii]
MSEGLLYRHPSTEIRSSLRSNSSGESNTANNSKHDSDLYHNVLHARSNVAFLSEIPIEEFVTKYQVVKISWRGKYERIFALAPTRFSTIDPRDFEVTNTWSLTAVTNISLDPLDSEGFKLTLKGTKKEEELKLCCRFRSQLLSDLYRLKFQYQQRNMQPETGVQCFKWSRNGDAIDCALRVEMDGVTVLQQGRTRSKYLYTEMGHLTMLTDSQDGFAIGYTGRSRLFFSQMRAQIYHCIQETAAAIGCKIHSKSDLTVERVQEERIYYGLDNGEPFVEFSVQKVTPKYKNMQDRILALHNEVIMELDSEDNVVTFYKYIDIYGLVRESKDSAQFDIQFRNGQVRTYMAKDRDGILCAIYDVSVTCEKNPELFIGGFVNQRGLRLLPFSAVEDATETQSFFNDSSIGAWYLQRLGSVGKVGITSKSGDRGFVEIVAEFNANVSASGIHYNTSQTIIKDALRPMCAQLHYVAKIKPVPERAAVTLLQALFRISSSYYGFQEIGQADMISDAMANLLINGEEFVVFWTTLLLRRLTAHAPPSDDPTSIERCDEVESQNKEIFLSNAHLTESLITRLNDIDMYLETSNLSQRPKAGPLVMMGLLQILEGCICSRATTTGQDEFKMLVSGVAKSYSTLLKTLFRSRCASTVEACTYFPLRSLSPCGCAYSLYYNLLLGTLLLKTTIEECDPDIASNIRDKALTEGVVLRHFYQVLFDESFDQRCVSRYLVSLWMSQHDRSKQLLSRMIPFGFLHFLKQPFGTAKQIEDYDRLEREIMKMEHQEQLREYSGDERASSTTESPTQGAVTDVISDEQVADFEIYHENIMRKTLSISDVANHGKQTSGIQSRNRCVSVPDLNNPVTRSLLPGQRSTLVRNRRDSFQAPIENKQSKARMLRKLNCSVSGASAGLQHAHFINHEVFSRSSYTQTNKPRLRKRDVARNFFDVFSGKKPSFLQINESSNEKSRGTSHSCHTQENFRLLFHMLTLDHESVQIIWNKQTREELRSALYAEIKRYTHFQISSGGTETQWNYQNYAVSYPSLANETVVGGCYIRLLTHLQNKLYNFEAVTLEDDFNEFSPEQVPVRDPGAVLVALYVRILRETINAEYRNDMEMSIMCIKSMGVVAAAHARNMDVVSFDEIDHLWTLMSETVQAPILVCLLRTVRALCLHPENARRVLSNEHNLELAIQLLQLAHMTKRVAGDDAKTKKLWILESDDGKKVESISLSKLKQRRNEKLIDVTSFRVKCHDDPTCEPISTKVKLTDIAQLRWEVGLRGDLHPLQMAHDAISVLLSVAHSNSLLSSNSASPIFPPPRGKTTLWRYIRPILPILLRSNHPVLWEKVASLLKFLFSDEQPITEIFEEGVSSRSSLFSWGLFYLAFLVESSDFEAMAGVLKATHKDQAGFDETSALRNILPLGMINLLDNLSSYAFAKVFRDGKQSPQVIWSASMRKHLQTQCRIHWQDYAEVLEENAYRDWRFCAMAPVAYKELLDEVWCGGVYLGQFCEHSDFSIADPVSFMKELTKEWRIEEHRQGSIDNGQARQLLGLTNEEDVEEYDAAIQTAFKEKSRILHSSSISASEFTTKLKKLQEAYWVLSCPRPSLLSAGHDPNNVMLLLHSLIIMCKRYPEELVNYEFDAYDLLLLLLHNYCTADGLVPEGTTAAQSLEISVCAAELLYDTCVVSSFKGKLLLEQPSLINLEKALNFCVSSSVDRDATKNTERLEVLYTLLQTVTEIVASPRGQSWIAESSTLPVDLVRILWMWNHAQKEAFILSKITQQALEVISRMAQLEKNQHRLVQAGVLWQLIKLFSRYNTELDDATVQTRLHESYTLEVEGYMTVVVEARNQLAIMAVRALCRLGGLLSDESGLLTPPNLLVKQVVDALMTPSLSELMLLSSHHEFLKFFHGEFESYTLIWNSEMRHELKKFVSARASVEPTLTTNENYVDAIRFRFINLADLFCVGGLYIEMLMAYLLVIEKSSDPVSIENLGLTEKFLKELCLFIDSGQLSLPELINKDGIIERLPPYAGWKVGEEQRTTMERVTALNCLSLTASVAPMLVETSLIGNDSAIKMLLRLSYPPGNKVQQSEDAENCLVLTQQLYLPCRLHCISTLQVLSKLDSFSFAALGIGICYILVELIHICPDVGPDALEIIRNFCANGAAIKCVSEILQSGIYLEFIGWMLLVEETIIDDKFDAAEGLRIPSVMILYEMIKDSAPLCSESRQALSRFFPPAIVRTIASSPETILEYIMTDHMTPVLVWNASFRDRLRNNVANFLTIYFSSTSVTTNKKSETFTSVVDSFEIDYSDLYSAPMAGNVYLSLYMKDPTFNVHDPLHFLTCLWSEFEILFRQLAIMTSAQRLTIDREENELIESDIDMIDLVGSSIVCLLQYETWLMENAVELQIPVKCCAYLNGTVRSQVCEPCVVNVVRIFRVCMMSQTCIESLQPMCSTALSCLMALVDPDRGGPLHFESAFVLDIIRRIVSEYPKHGDQDTSSGIVYLANRLGLFDFLLNMLDFPSSIGKVKESRIVRAEAIEILNALENDGVQGSTAHQILKKHKKWQKRYRHEPTDVVKSMLTEDPFLKLLFPEADRVMRSLV